MERVELRVQSRQVKGKQVRQMRAEEWIPAVIYGHDVAPRPIQAQERPLVKVLRQAGSTSLIDLYVDDAPLPTAVLAREVQHNPTNGRLLHVDFYQVRLTEKVKTSPRLHFVGEPAAVKASQAVLLHNLTELEIECLPTELIHAIEVDVSGLEHVGDSILVRDLKIPTGITVLAEPDEPVATLVPTRLARIEEAAAEEVAEAPAKAAEE